MGDLTMKSGTRLTSVIALATITILALGCSPTGWAVREIPDGSNLQPNEQVTVILHDGSVISGEYMGEATIPLKDYITQYGHAALHSTEGTFLPAIGQNVKVTTTLSDTKFWTGQLVGFDLENIWMKFPGNAKSEPIYFSSITSLSDGTGGVIRQTMLRGLFLNGAIPLMSALKFKIEESEIFVPISSIRKLVVNDGVDRLTRTINGITLRGSYLQY